MSDDGEDLRAIYDTLMDLNKRIAVENECIIIHVQDGYDYTIDLSRCDSFDKIVGWIHHLCEKTWMTREMIERFINVALQANNLKLAHP